MCDSEMRPVYEQDLLVHRWALGLAVNGSVYTTLTSRCVVIARRVGRRVAVCVCVWRSAHRSRL